MGGGWCGSESIQLARAYSALLKPTPTEELSRLRRIIALIILNYEIK
jgi:hypothetical protein